MNRRFPVLAAGALAVCCASAAWARVGGGGGYSGGGHSGGGGGDAGLVFALVRLLLWLVFAHPVVGIPLLIVVVIVVVNMAKSGAFQASAAERPVVLPQPLPSNLPANLTPVRATDPSFSEPVFLDFAQLVYARAHELRGAGNREPLRTLLSTTAIDTLFADRVNLESVSEVVFGASRIAQAATESGFVRLDVSFEANVTEVRSGVRAQVLCHERWSFRRRAGVRSPEPSRMRTLGCAGCGSTLEPKADGTCASCGAPRRGGLTQWEVAGIPYASRRPLTPPELETGEGSGVERGTERATVFDPRLQAARRAFEGSHPDHDWAAFETRVRTAFLALQDAWSRREWERARPFETDGLFQTHRFWMERYAAFGLVNRVEDVSVTKVVLVKLDVDAYYEAITVRLFASARDWTEDGAGRVVSGSRTDPRAFSEYWTFLRAVGVAVKPPQACPSCGAPLPAGGGSLVCGSCGGKLVGDAADWVASRIEQDDAY